MAENESEKKLNKFQRRILLIIYELSVSGRRRLGPPAVESGLGATLLDADSYVCLEGCVPFPLVLAEFCDPQSGTIKVEGLSIEGTLNQLESLGLIERSSFFARIGFYERSDKAGVCVERNPDSTAAFQSYRVSVNGHPVAVFDDALESMSAGWPIRTDVLGYKLTHIGMGAIEAMLSRDGNGDAAMSGTDDGDVPGSIPGASTANGQRVPAVEWSEPMSKAELARRIYDGRKNRGRDVNPLLKKYGFEKITKVLIRVRLDQMDAATRRKVESPA